MPLALRKEVLGRVLRLRTAITKATEFRIGEDTSFDKKVELLRGDISNAPSHVYGEHARCKDINYFKCDNKNEKNLVLAMKDCGIYDDILTALKRLEDNASSLIMNMDNNLAEHYNSVVCKFIGGKRINFCRKGSYQTRCQAAAVSFNSKEDYYRVIHKVANEKSPGHFTKKFLKSKLKRNSVIKKRLFKKKPKNVKSSLPDKDYGPDASYLPMDLDSDLYKIKAVEFLKTLKKN